jgi:hypothetical protein
VRLEHVLDSDRNLVCKARTIIGIPSIRNSGRTNCQGSTAMHLLESMFVHICSLGLRCLLDFWNFNLRRSIELEQANRERILYILSVLKWLTRSLYILFLCIHKRYVCLIGVFCEVKNESGVQNELANSRNGVSMMNSQVWGLDLNLPTEQDHRTRNRC